VGSETKQSEDTFEGASEVVRAATDILSDDGSITFGDLGH
jgi:hypothetical protein